MSDSSNRILIVGPTGSGKTTVARLIGQRASLPVVELDNLFWGPGWSRREEFLDEAREWIERERWVIEGSYGAVVEAAWPRAELVVWLDLSLRVALAQLMRRTLLRVWGHKTAPHGNRESIRSAFFSNDSIVLWLLRTYHRKRRQFASVAAQFPNIQLVRIRTRRERDEWLAEWSNPAPGYFPHTGA